MVKIYQIILMIGICWVTCLSQASATNAPWVGETLKGNPCTGRDQGVGPYDYLQRFSIPDKLSVVERGHFTPNVQNLIRGQSAAIPSDINYTLSAWPNHHKALIAISRYQFLHESSSEKRYQKKPASPVECYFQRAINFSPKDAITHMLYAIHLHKEVHYLKANTQYQNALELSPNNSSIHYNYGLLLVSMKKYEQAQYHATKAYQTGYPLQGLKKKLQKAGYWLQNQNTTPSSDE